MSDITPRKIIADMDENEIATLIVNVCYLIHTQTGPGLLESVYETILHHELTQRGLKVDRQVTLPVIWDGLRIDEGFRIDLIVEDKVIIELKSVPEISKVFLKQLLTYLKLSNKRLGLLVNFGAAAIKDGIERVVNRL